MSKKQNNIAYLKSEIKPDENQINRLKAFIKTKYEIEYEIEWKEDPLIENGFVLSVGKDIYDWSLEGRMRQLKEHIDKLPATHDTIVPLIKDTANTWTPVIQSEELGAVVTVGDEVATVSGLSSAKYGEILLFPSGVKGMAQDLREDEIGCILFGSGDEIAEGDRVKLTGKMAGIPVGNDFLGRVIDPLGNPIDGKGSIHSSAYRPIETPAPGIIDRQPVNRPLETGLLVIDSMFPIGRGQRELIIGDRQTGKTAIAIDTIINQKGKDVICIYVAIGQKTSSVVQIANTLREHDAMDYSIIVSASASDSATLQYIAPYAGCAMGEYFMNNGRDVLIVYDDLSKHAIAYRAISLLLERSPGREAYPGDVFYLHSRLLERSAHLSDERGGGSLTALPIVETQAGDISAYIPTNIISITDGQIFLESELFFTGQKPAVNIGISVSRVGGDAQTSAMKKARKTLRLDLAQYREMEAFTQFSGELDDASKKQLVYGMNLMYLLRQGQYSPYSQHSQIFILIAALNHVVEKVDNSKVEKYLKEFINHMEKRAKSICRSIDRDGDISDKDYETVLNMAKTFTDNYLEGLNKTESN